MARPVTRKLPSIAVEEDSIRTRVDLTQALHGELECYARYWTNETGRKPRSLNDVIVAILTEYLASDTAFQTWRRDRAGTAVDDHPFSQRLESTSK